MINNLNIPLTVEGGKGYRLKVSDGQSVTLGVGTEIRAAVTERYDGPYQVTPGQAAQVLQTSGKVMGDNVTVEAIPSNYGLITWNGSVLTVS